jgi:hypothetical protein
MRIRTSYGWVSALASLALAAGCSASADDAGSGGSGQASSSTSSPSGTGAGNNGSGAGTTGAFMSGSGGGGGGEYLGDPVNCEQALAAKTYIGCDFWPTVTANNVWNIFDFAVVVANAGTEPANITVERGNNVVATTTVAPDSTGTIYLPWVPELKGPEAGSCGEATPLSGTVRSTGGAYHLTSSVPVTVYQFNALEYAPEGGPPGKNWGACPGYSCPVLGDCYSYSNDASLLLPAPALTGNYRIFGYPGWAQADIGGTVSITGTADSTTVFVTMGGLASLQPGGGLGGASPGQQFGFPLQRGEVVQLYGAPNADWSGTLIQADKPVQVVHGMPCTQVPYGVSACDHIEESVFPAETLGKQYIVASPTSPTGQANPHVVRIYGNVDGTTLTYPGGAPPNAPTTIGAGQFVDLGVVNQNFEIVGSNEFAVSMFQVGAELASGGGAVAPGDPAQSIATAVEQYRTKYVFLAPLDYDTNYVDVIMPMGANVVLDGAPIAATPTPISSGYGVARVLLADNGQGGHVLTSDLPVGIQVLGYGAYTSYQYPGGLNLELIAPPPPPPQ